MNGAILLNATRSDQQIVSGETFSSRKAGKVSLPKLKPTQVVSMHREIRFDLFDLAIARMSLGPILLMLSARLRLQARRSGVD